MKAFRKLEDKLKKELSDILAKEEFMWLQHSRRRWLADEDINTKYYHMKTTTRRRRNKIAMLKNDQGNWVDDDTELNKLVNKYYKNLFEIKFRWKKCLPTVIKFPAMIEKDSQILSKQVENEEIMQEVFGMKPWKSPRPGKFPTGFYQKAWNKVGEKVCDFIKRLWNCPSEIMNIYQTDICLIPKVGAPQVVSQFRPIYLCNTIYKIASKMVVNRMKGCMAKLISPFETGFIMGRSIHENVIVAKEVLHLMHQKKGSK